MSYLDPYGPGMPFYLAVDLETTGLDPQRDPILEVAWAVLDYQLNEVAPIESAVAALTPQVRIRLAQNDYVRQMHTDNGLITDSARWGIALGEVELRILRQVKLLQAPKPLTVFGSSVHYDKAFIDAQMPALAEKLHYRIFDVTTTLNLFGAAGAWEDSRETIAHRAADDIRWSINEARKLRDRIQEAA